MKILAISGRNLASLAGDFRVDFETPPLAGAGLFAITGETGAGKSTLLDAVCLALYGTMPRLKAEGDREALADVGGQTLAATDPRSVLRRGASEGHAALEFEVEGVRYRAVWQVRRARDRPDGRLQTPTRALIRLDDGRVIASGLTDCSAAVLDLVRLSFDQFRRTVLLAQGDFDAFLKAGEGARAELLERITGTEIYRRVSQRMFEREREQRAAVEAMEGRLDMVDVLDEEARAALDAERDVLLAEREEKRAMRDAARAAIDWYRQDRKLADEIVAAENEVAQRRAAVEAMAGERKRLREFDATEMLRPLHRRWRESEQRVIEARQRHERAVRDHAAALVEQVVCECHAEIAQAAERHAQRRFDAAGPLLSEAADLDARLAGAEERLGKAEAERQRRLAAVEEAAANGSRLGGKLDSLNARLASLAGDPAANSALGGLEGRLAEIRSAFRRFDGLVDEARRRRREIESDEAARDARQSRAEGLKERIAEIEAELVRARADAKRARMALAEMEPGRLRARLDELRAAEELIRRARALAETGRHAAEDEVRLGEEIAARDATLARAQARLGKALAQLDSLDETRDGVSTRGGAGAASSEATALRAELVAGEPCPVCGSRSHPGWAERELDGLASELRAHALEVEHQKRAAEAEKRAAEIEIAEMTVRGEHLRRQQGEAATRRAGAMRDLEELQAQLSGIGAARDVAIDPGTGDFGRLADGLGQCLAGIDAERRALAVSLDRGRALEEEIATLAARIEGKGEEMARLGTERLEASENEARLAGEIEGRRAKLEVIETERDRLAETLQGYLASAGCDDSDLAADARAGLSRLERAVGEFSEREAQRRRLEAEIEGVRADRKAAEALEREAGKELRDADAAVAEARRAGADLRRRRAALFGGEATEAVRRKLAAAVGRCRQWRERTVAAREAARGRAGLAGQAVAVAARGLEEVLGERDTARGDLVGGLAGVGMDLAAAERLFTTAPEEVAALRARLEKADAEFAEAAARLEDRRRRGREHRQALPGLKEGRAVALAAEAERALAAADARIGALREKIAHDDRARADAARLAAEIVEMQAEYRVVAAISEAIGSRDGNRFRRFAQGITLDLLVALASEQLRQIEPRYRLQRVGDLGLQVVDRMMGDEVRSVRSLSGGESFLVSLALALALSSLEEGGHFVDTLLIDEGFGSLDAGALDMAITALEALQSRGRRVGVISHVAAMQERIPIQIHVEKLDQGRGRVRITDRTPG